MGHLVEERGDVVWRGSHVVVVRPSCWQSLSEESTRRIYKYRATLQQYGQRTHQTMSVSCNSFLYLHSV